MTTLFLAWRSAWSRRGALALALLSIALSAALLLAVERVRDAARAGFDASLSGIDLVVGPRDHPLRLVLHAVFHLGQGDANLSWDSAERLARHPAVAWTVPLALGDSHRGFPVVATSDAYFEHYRYGRGQALAFTEGRRFDGLFDIVLGAEAARRLGYRIGDRLELAHGHDHGHGEHIHHGRPFTVSGVLAPTGTPADRGLYIGLPAMKAIHLDWQGGAPLPGVRLSADDLRKFDLAPDQVTAVLVGLRQRAAVLGLQRSLNTNSGEPMTTVMPAVALDELWQLTASAERALQALSALVGVVALCGLASTVLAGLNERRRELAVLRAIGTRPGRIFLLLVCEGGVLTALGAILGLAAVQLAALALGPWLLAHWGLALEPGWPGARDLALLAAIVGAGLAASALPAWRAYRLSLADGLAPRS